MFARGQAIVAGPKPGQLPLFLKPIAIPPDGTVNGGEQSLLIERFEQIESEDSNSEAEPSSSAETAPDKGGDADAAASDPGGLDSEGSDSGTTTYQAPSYDTPNQGY